LSTRLQGIPEDYGRTSSVGGGILEVKEGTKASALAAKRIYIKEPKGNVKVRKSTNLSAETNTSEFKAT
jgi:hypothetical protein